ncbi:DUF3732 domain-containing protein [Vibrio splendidus]|uniref:DUF3732 domain-containing protein n=1 Tax=Vibrio splendidus TaxID=29497 RepID=UPI001E2EBE3F|nr:DUF3732 domain-containing protein [Vibrio splendidus]MCC4862131.1 DUF3732 domain-containing protein [Vibrio splendidus]
MQIKTISVYSKERKRNDVSFSLGTLNILTGASKRGKSQLIEIIDYCLGSTECNVADGLITDTVSWYSVLFQFNDCQVYIARKAPEAGFRSSSKCDLRVGRQLAILSYDEINPSTNVAGVQEFLTRKMGISDYVTEVPESNTRSSISISFKHSKTYVFQAQDELASKRILFHRQAEPFIPQSIKDTLPYFMGASGEDRLHDLEKLRKLKREKTKLKKKIKEVQQLKGEGLSKGRNLLAEAIGCRIADSNIQVDDGKLVSLLKGLLDISPSSSKHLEFNEDPLRQLELELEQLRDKKKVTRAKIDSISSYHDNLKTIDNEFNEQYLRLQSINLFSRVNSGNVSFQECLGHVKNAIEDNSRKLSKDLEGLNRTKPKLNIALNELGNEDVNLAKEIKRVRKAIETLMKQKGKLAAARSLEYKQALVIGRVSLYLESLNWDSDTSQFESSIRLLEPKIEELEAKLNPSELKLKLESQLSNVAEDMTRWARDLGLEHSQYPIRLDPATLTVTAETPNGRTPLNRMGSGANWVGYHLVTYVALAKWFITQDRPVPNFIFFDQPTQVFFPSDITSSGKVSEIEADEDRKAVVDMFRWLSKVTQELAPALQIIVTDHADIDEEWFQSHTVTPKWRGEQALIPYSWVPEGYNEQVK